MITIAMMMKMIGTMQEEIMVGVKNVVAERVIRAMMTIMIMITKRMTTIKMEMIETVTGEVIVGENLVEENAARIVG